VVALHGRSFTRRDIAAHAGALSQFADVIAAIAQQPVDDFPQPSERWDQIPGG
jgi:hypothetical protein